MRSLALFTAAVFATVANAQKNGTYADANAEKAVKFAEDTDEIDYTVEKQTRYGAYDGDVYDNFDVSSTNELEYNPADLDTVNWNGTDPKDIFKVLSRTPFWLENRQKIWNDAVKDLDTLAVVCPKGRQCRHEERIALGKRLVTQWQTLIDSFRTQIAGEIVDTKNEIKKSHEVFVQCAVDDDCCPTNDVTIENWYIQITDYKNKMNALLLERVVTMNKIEEIKKECPEVAAAYTTPVDRFDVTDSDVGGNQTVITTGGSSNQTQTQTSSRTTVSSSCVSGRFMTETCKNGTDCVSVDEGDEAAVQNCQGGGFGQGDAATGSETRTETSTETRTRKVCVDGFYIVETCTGEVCQPPTQGEAC